MIITGHPNELLGGPRGPSGSRLDWEVRDVMSPGVTVVVEDASLRQVYRALALHRVHAILVLGLADGRPIGWVTAKSLLRWLGEDDSLRCARDAVTEAPTTIDPSASAAEAVAALSRSDVSRLLVQRASDVLPEGVVTEMDLVAPRLV